MTDETDNNETIVIIPSDLESQPTEDKIHIGKSYPDSKKHSFIDQLYSKIILRNIKILDNENKPKEVSKRNILEEIRSQPPSVEELINILDNPISDPDEKDRIAAIYVSAETNQSSAMESVKNLRANTPSLITVEHPHESYTQGAWYAFPDLEALATRWHLPLMTIRKDANHWILALKEPERTNNGWRVLVYDPMENLESWQYLDNYDPDLTNPSDLVGSGIFMNKLAYTALKAKEYNLSLSGDTDLANHAEIYKAKQVRTQFNSEDCGPLTLFAAALRQGVKPGWNEFKFAGREQMEKDTNTKIYTREELHLD